MKQSPIETAGALLLLGGAGLAAYFMLKPKKEESAAETGSIPFLPRQLDPTSTNNVVNVASGSNGSGPSRNPDGTPARSPNVAAYATGAAALLAAPVIGFATPAAALAAAAAGAYGVGTIASNYFLDKLKKAGIADNGDSLGTGLYAYFNASKDQWAGSSTDTRVHPATGNVLLIETTANGTTSRIRSVKLPGRAAFTPLAVPQAIAPTWRLWSKP